MSIRSSVAAGFRRLADKLGQPAFAGTPFPGGGVTSPTQLTAELGGSGTFNFGGFIRGEDYNPAMDALTAIANFDEMRRSDSQVHAALEVVKLPIRTADYEIDPSDPSDPDAIEIAEFVRWNLFEGMTTTWDDVIRQSLLMLDFGFMLFEKVWTVAEEGDWAGKIIVHKLAPRQPKTLWQWFTDEDGALISIKQLAVKAGTYQFLDCPASKLVRFTFQQEGDNFMGLSLLRNSYPNWLIKKNLYVTDAIRAQRFGVGIPRATLKDGYSPTREDQAGLVQMLQGMSSHQHAYLVQPPQVVVDILMPQGVQGGAQLMPSIEHHNAQITKNILAQFLDMGGKASGGSRALGASAMDFFLNAIESIADQICDVLNKQLIQDLVDMNFEGAKYPTLRPVGIQETDVKSLAAAAAALAQVGLLTVDKKTENTFRNLLNLPEVADDSDTTPPDSNSGGSVTYTPPPAGASPASGPVSAPAAATAVPATTSPMPATPATAAPMPATPATAIPSAATPATRTAQPAVLQPGTPPTAVAQDEVAAPLAVLPSPPTQPPPYANKPVEGVAGRPKAQPLPSQPANTTHDPREPLEARTSTYGTMPAETTWQTPAPAVSTVRDPAPAVSTISRNVPATATMARSTTASSGDADEEGHTTSGKTVAAADRPPSAAPSTTDLAIRATPTSAMAPPRPPTVALASRKPPTTWTTEDGQTSFWRPPTALETRVLDLREMPKRLSIARTALQNTLRGVKEEQILRIAQAVAQAPDGTIPKAPLVGKMASDINKAQQELYQYGYHTVGQELQRQKRAARLADVRPSNARTLGGEGSGRRGHGEAPAVVFAGDPPKKPRPADDNPDDDPDADDSDDDDDLGDEPADDLGDEPDDLFGDAAEEAEPPTGGGLVSDVEDVAEDASKLESEGLAAAIGAGGIGGKFAVADHPKLLKASAQLSAQTAADRLLATARQESLRLKRAGWSPSEIEDALKIHLGELTDGDISRMASMEVNEAFSLGRVAASKEFKDSIEKAIYSAILDNNCCQVCEDLDGEEFEVDSDDYEEVTPPNPNCEGGDACRCTWIYLLATDNE